MKTLASVIAAAICLTGCVTAPTDPAALAAWNAEKTARTEARRPEGGSVLAGKRQYQDGDFEALKKEIEAPDVSDVWE